MAVQQLTFPGGTLAFGPNTLWATYTPDSTSSPIYYGATGISAPVTVALYLTGPNGEFDWTWMGGSSTVPSAGVGQNGVYPAQPGPPASDAIYPGGRESPYMWADNGGNIWLFGGGGYDSAGNSGFLNDFWEFTPSTGMWTWVGGSNLAGGTEVDCGLGCFAATTFLRLTRWARTGPISAAISGFLEAGNPKVPTCGSTVRPKTNGP